MTVLNQKKKIKFLPQLQLRQPYYNFSQIITDDINLKHQKDF